MIDELFVVSIIISLGSGLVVYTSLKKLMRL